jgi:hypothetical protein
MFETSRTFTTSENSAETSNSRRHVYRLFPQVQASSHLLGKKRSGNGSRCRAKKKEEKKKRAVI